MIRFGVSPTLELGFLVPMILGAACFVLSRFFKGQNIAGDELGEEALADKSIRSAMAEISIPEET